MESEAERTKEKEDKIKKRRLSNGQEREERGKGRRWQIKDGGKERKQW